MSNALSVSEPSGPSRRVLVALLVLLAAVVAAVVLVLVWMNWSNPPREQRREPDPIAVVPGEAFEFDGFSYAADWELRAQLGELTATGLTVTNMGEDLAYPSIEIILEQGLEEVAVISCSGSALKEGESVLLQCASEDDPPSEYDRVVVVDGR